MSVCGTTLNSYPIILLSNTILQLKKLLPKEYQGGKWREVLNKVVLRVLLVYRRSYQLHSVVCT